MKVVIHPSRVTGIVSAPPSKSSMQRACAAAWIRGGSCALYHPGSANDDLVALDIIRQMGSVVEEKGGILLIDTAEKKFPSKIFCGESGLSARMFTPLACLSPNEVQIAGSGSLIKRSFSTFEKVFPQLGVAFSSNNGFLPLRVKGPLIPGDIVMDGSMSSQFTTGLIMAYVAAGASDKTIRVTDLQSKPYVDLTLEVLKGFGLAVPENRDYQEFYFNKDKPALQEEVIQYSIESDWSGAAFLLVAGALAGPLVVRDLDLLSVQADRAIFDILMQANAAVTVESKGIRILPAPMNGFDTDASDFPDLFPPLVALAVMCEGQSIIKGADRLKHKESDRSVALQEEFTKLGAVVDVKKDVMRIEGGAKLKGCTVDSHGDHRIAMALAIAALKAEGPTTIEGAGAVNKSFPGFFETLRSLGASLTLQES
jgi:3-phosphoshikimate 1-carboxyvinyltransferase